MRTTNNIENLAVSRIVELFSSCKRIWPRINSCDKEPLWDGSLFLYDSEEHSNSSLLGRVPCQVKGKDDPSNTKEESYYLTREELANYLRDGGVLFLLVHVGIISKPTYWAKLTPVELRNCLKESEGKDSKGKSIKLLHIPDDYDQIEKECFDFHRHCQLQKAPPVDIEQIPHLGGKFQIVGVEKDGLPPIVALTKGTHYLYKCDEDDKILGVIGDSRFSLEMSQEVDDRIVIGGKEFLVPVTMVMAKGTSYLTVGDFMTIDIIVAEGSKRTLSFSADRTKGVRLRSLALKVLLAMNDAVDFTFPASNTVMSCEAVRLSERMISEVHAELDNLHKVLGFLDRLHITSDLDLETLSKKDLAELNLLYKAIMEDKTVKLDSSDDNLLRTTVKIGKLAILVWVVKEEDGYHVRDFFGTNEYDVAVEDKETGAKCRVSRFSLLDSKDYNSVANIDWQLIPADYKGLDLHVEEVSKLVNQDALNLLTAYDKTKRKEILDAVIRLTDWLVEVGRGTNESIIFRINNLQAIKRSRLLSETEMKEVINYSDDPSATLELKYCCDLLLDDQRRASHHLSEMTEDLRQYYKKLPITRFYRS